MSELGPNALGQHLDPGRATDGYLALPLPVRGGQGQGGVLVVTPRVLLHLSVPQPAGSLLYELTTGHPDRQPGELVFPADLAVELRAWPRERWAPRGVDLEQLGASVVGCWRRGDLRGLELPLDTGEEARAVTRPAMTLARAEVLPACPAGRSCPPPLAAPRQPSRGRRPVPVARLLDRREAGRRHADPTPAGHKISKVCSRRTAPVRCGHWASGALSTADGAPVRPWTLGG